ncbi:hypothetical protein WJX72_001661 [[Myrmecia] bisecta]|uniref:Uncharacterized protein n=1 Tax=[Myrmecia] bisecta TaxID=41462 RepID=A0AAW1PBY5_9CHLO
MKRSKQYAAKRLKMSGLKYGVNCSEALYASLPWLNLKMDGLEEVKSELRRVTAELTPLQTARNAEALKRDADQAYIDRLTAAAAPLEAQVLSLTERAKQLEGRAGQAGVAPIGYSWEATLPVLTKLTPAEEARGFVLCWIRSGGASGSNTAEACGAGSCTDWPITEDEILDYAFTQTSPLDDGVVHVQLRVAINDPAAFTSYTTIQAAMQVLLLEDYEDNARPIHVKGLIERFDLEANAQQQLPDWCQQFLGSERKTAWTVRKIVDRAVESIGFVLCTAARGSSEATKRLFVDVIVKAAVLIAVSVCELDQHELLMELEVNLKGNTAAGDLDYLLILVNERLAVLEAKADSIAAENQQPQAEAGRTWRADKWH